MEPEKIITLGRLFVDGAEGTARRLVMAGTGWCLISLVHVTDSAALYVGGPDVAADVFSVLSDTYPDISRWFKTLGELPQAGIIELAEYLGSRNLVVVGDPTAGSSGAFIVIADEDGAEWWGSRLESRKCPDPTESGLFFPETP